MYFARVEFRKCRRVWRVSAVRLSGRLSRLFVILIAVSYTHLTLPTILRV